MGGLAAWLKKEIDDEEFYSGGPRPVERLSVLREVQEKLVSTNAESYVTVADLKRGTYRTSHGQPQEGIAFVCLEHGIQGFHSFHHSPMAPLGIQLDCGCFFMINRGTGAISK